jgi:tetratricopeptide (TPR) repeat protein
MDPYFWQAHVALARACLQKGRYEEVIVRFLRASSHTPDNTDTLASLGHAYAVSGKRDEALKVLNQLIELSQQRYVSAYDIAIIHTGLDDESSAFNWLDRADSEQAEWLIYINVDPRLEPLRTAPRFADMVRRVGFAPTPHL